MKLLRKFLSILLIAAMILGVVSCKEKPNDQPDNNSDNTDNSGGDYTPVYSDYTVTVVNPMGAPVSGVSVFVHEDGGADYNVCTAPKDTDDDGRAVFTLEVGKLYSVSLLGVPSIYTAKPGTTRADRYIIESTDTVVTLDANEDYVPTTFQLGDTMVNFTLTDIDGNVYELYDLLEEKRAVVLNFWFYGCGPCRSEFPSLNSAYNTYKDVIEVLAINDYPYESSYHVKNFEADAGLTLDMPLFRGEYGSRVSISRFKNEGYPTTVVIDRNGRICFIHSGAVTSTAKWNKLFAFFTADDYTTTIIKSIDDIP